MSTHWLAIDTDPGVDDAFAFVLALNSPEIRVALTTSVAGNVPVALATRNAGRLLQWLAPESMPAVARGASAPRAGKLVTAKHIHGSDGLGGITELVDAKGQPHLPRVVSTPRARGDAAQALVDLARQHGQNSSIVAVGPLTNIAQAIELDARAMRRIKRLVVMGGAIAEPGNVTPLAEFNIYVDPEAADIVLTSGVPITLVPLDVTHRVRLTRGFVKDRMKGARGVRARLVRALSRFAHAGRFARDGFPLHDPLAVAVAIDPTLVRCEKLVTRVETRGEHTRGMTVADRRVEPFNPMHGAAIDVALEVDTPAALEMFARRVLDP